MSQNNFDSLKQASIRLTFEISVLFIMIASFLKNNAAVLSSSSLTERSVASREEG